MGNPERKRKFIDDGLSGARADFQKTHPALSFAESKLRPVKSAAER
jgi:hypothetical protein